MLCIQSCQCFIVLPAVFQGTNKREFLKRILPTIGANLRWQRLYTEYQEQLESLDTWPSFPWKQIKWILLSWRLKRQSLWPCWRGNRYKWRLSCQGNLQEALWPCFLWKPIRWRLLSWKFARDAFDFWCHGNTLSILQSRTVVSTNGRFISFGPWKHSYPLCVTSRWFERRRYHPVQVKCWDVFLRVFKVTVPTLPVSMYDLDRSPWHVTLTCADTCLTVWPPIWSCSILIFFMAVENDILLEKDLVVSICCGQIWASIISTFKPVMVDCWFSMKWFGMKCRLPCVDLLPKKKNIVEHPS